jgi:Arv1-like family
MKRQRAPTDPTRLSSQPPKYRCLWCLTPCEALYRNLGEKGDGAGRGGGDNNLQLSTCHQCREIVDPYCERELLLVAMDVVLLRPEAYRHALLNRTHLSKELGCETTPAARIDDVGGGVTATMALSSVLRALSLSATASTLDQPTAFFLFLGMSVMKQGVLYCLIWSFCRWWFRSKDDASVASDRLALALGLPELGFCALALLVQVWEDSSAVRAMGSLLSVTCQTMALLALVDDASAQRIRRQNGRSSWGPNDHCWMVTLSIMGLSLLVRAATVALVASCVPTPTSYSYDVVAAATTNFCSGLQLSQLIPHWTFRDNLERLLDVCWT